MSDTPQLERGEAQRDDSAAEQGQQAMQAAIQFPMTQAVSAQKGAAELFLNGLEIGTWANRQRMEMVKDAMETYLQTLDRTAARTGRVVEENAELFEGVARTQREIGEESVDRLAEGMGEGIEQSQGQFHSTVERFPPSATEQRPQESGQTQATRRSPQQVTPTQGAQPRGSAGGQGQQPPPTQDQQGPAMQGLQGPATQGEQAPPSQGQQAPAMQGQQTPPGQDQTTPPRQPQQWTAAPQGSQPPQQPPTKNQPTPAAPPQAPPFQPPAGQQFGEYGNPPEQGQQPTSQPTPEYGASQEGSQGSFGGDQQAQLFEEPAPGGPTSPGPGPQ